MSRQIITVAITDIQKKNCTRATTLERSTEATTRVAYNSFDLLQTLH